MNLIEITPKESIIFENDKAIVAMAFEPHTKGHCIVIWKSGAEDLNKLSMGDYEYLMDIVDVTRNVLMSFYGVDKVYLMYLNEANWVHWHLIPRYEEKGFNILRHNPEIIKDFSDTVELSRMFSEQFKGLKYEIYFTPITISISGISDPLFILKRSSLNLLPVSLNPRRS